MSAPALSLRRDLLWELIARDIRLRYRGRVLGLLWTQLGPLVSVIVFSFVFARVIPLGIPNYPVFILIGVEAWQWFQGGLAAGASSVVGNRELVRHPGFPLRALPPFAVGSQLAFYLFSLPIIVAAVVVTTGRLPITAVWVPVVITVQFALCLGGAYVLATLQVFLRDTAEVLGVVLRLMFFVTPIIYDESLLRASRFHLLFDINPMAHLVSAQRDALLLGRTPRLIPLIAVALFSAVLLGAGRTVFSRFRHRFPDEV